MVAIKTAQVAQLLKSPDARFSAFLFFGVDEGLVSERAQRLARTLAERENPPGEILRLDDADLESDSDRLAVELQTVPMFGGRKIVRVTTGRRINANLLKPLIQGEPLAGFLIVEAGNMKADDTLRAAFEKGASTAAIGCYADGVSDLGGVIDEVLRAAGLSIESGAREALISRLGADRALSRAEVEKLALYAHGKGEVGFDDVEAIVGDASEQTLDKVAIAAGSGDGARAVIECDRAVHGGENAQSVILAVQRHFQRLHRLKASIDGGRSLEDAFRGLRPPLPMKVKDQISGQLRLWTGEKLNRALNGISKAAKAARLAGPLEQALAERLVLDLARLAKSGGGAAGR